MDNIVHGRRTHLSFFMPNLWRVLALFPLTGLVLLSGCIGGRVLYPDGTPVAGLQVTITECSGCPGVTVTTDSSGIYQHDPYIDGNTILNPEDGVIVTVGSKSWVTTEGSGKFRRDYCNSTETVQVSHLPDFQTDPDTGKSYTIVPDIYVAKMKMRMDLGDTCPFNFSPYEENFPGDSDRDGLANTVEPKYGTDPNNADTDGDGLSDGVEIRGSHADYYRASSKFAWRRRWVPKSDIASRGASPFRKNAFVEVDYWEDDTGTMRPGIELQNMIATHFALLTNILNPDGSRGIDILLYIDQELSTLTECTKEQLEGDAWAQYRSPRRDGVFTHGLFCKGGTGGVGFIPGGSFFVRGKTNFNTTDDLSEEAQNVLFSSFLHEFGHTIGLRHGGHEERNCKPNYPSDMNYAYFPAFGIDGDNYSLSSTRSQYSTGLLPEIVESTVSEYDPLDAPFGSVSFLEVFGGKTSTRYLTFPASNGNTNVDWNRDGVPSQGPPPDPVRTGGDPGCDDTTFRTIVDSDDQSTIQLRNRLSRHSASGGGETAEAGDTAIDCGSAEPLEDALELDQTRPWISAEARDRLTELTGLSDDGLRSWVGLAGFDASQRDDVRRLEKSIDRLARGSAAKRLLKTGARGRDTAWLPREIAEAEVIERGRELLGQWLGRPIELSFVDCPFDLETVLRPRAHSVRDATFVQRWEDLDHIKICR